MCWKGQSDRYVSLYKISVSEQLSKFDIGPFMEYTHSNNKA